MCEWCGGLKRPGERPAEVKMDAVMDSEKFGAGSNMHVHHIDYDRVGNERVSDLVVVCRDCHGELHRMIDSRVRDGLTRRAAMKELKPKCIARMLELHERMQFMRNQT